MTGDVDIRVAGQPLTGYGTVGDPTIDHQWPLGFYEASWTLLTRTGARLPQVSKNDPVDVYFAGAPIGAGQIADHNPDAGTYVAAGACRLAETIPALTVANVMTSVADTAVDANIARGEWPITRRASISTTPFVGGDVATDKVNITSLLLDNVTLEQGRRWYIDPYRQLATDVDPTTPSFFVLPGADRLAWSNQVQATKVIGSYTDDKGRGAFVTKGSGSIVEVVDMRDLGYITPARADTIATQILAGLSVGGWSGDVTLYEGQVVTGAGQPVELAQLADQVGRGCMLRWLGQTEPRADRVPVDYIDAVIARSSWKVADHTVTVTAAGSAAASVEDMFAQYGVQSA